MLGFLSFSLSLVFFFFFFYDVYASAFLRTGCYAPGHDRTQPPLSGFKQYSGDLICLAQGLNMAPNPGPLYSESDALPLSHRSLH